MKYIIRYIETHIIDKAEPHELGALAGCLFVITTILLSWI